PYLSANRDNPLRDSNLRPGNASRSRSPVHGVVPGGTLATEEELGLGFPNPFVRVLGDRAASRCLRPI
ncbi:hypothetical protein BHM03_00055628, partial [Ensete ventricosum]